MAFLTCAAFKLAYYGSTIVYPALQFKNAQKEGSGEKLCFNLLCCCAWPIVKILFALWLYYPTFRGALFVNQKVEKFYPLIFQYSSHLGKVFNNLGYEQKVVEVIHSSPVEKSAN